MSTPGRGLHGRVLDTPGPAITAGEYPPGSVLRTDELAQHFEESRSVMREAVRVLESMHLVESRRPARDGRAVRRTHRVRTRHGGQLTRPQTGEVPGPRHRLPPGGPHRLRKR